jgi:hypothetical protein
MCTAQYMLVKDAKTTQPYQTVDHSVSRPAYWPSAVVWPLIRSGILVSVVAELESLPPVFVMSDDTRVYGE